MNSENSMNSAGPLQGRTILFVEDRPDSILYFVEQLKRQEVQIRILRRISSVLDLLQEGDQRVHFVCIDLFLDESDPRLAGYRDKVELTDTNQGQLLGLFLQDKKIPYLYLTAYPPWFQENEQEREVQVFEKISSSYEKLVEHIESKISRQSKATRDRS